MSLLYQRFEVQFSNTNFIDQDSVEIVNVTNGNTFAMLTSLDPNQAYMFRAAGVTQQDDLIVSDVVHFKIKPKSKTTIH